MTTVNSHLADALRDRYQLDRELGRGGMATVYLARDLKHDRPVALKVMHADLAVTVGPERFLREIHTTAALQHPHILPVLDSGRDAGLLWYTMPYVQGESLRDRLRREVQLPLETALELTRQVAFAVDHANRHGVIHRDLKPENILLSEGQALVADFGVAKALLPSSGEELTSTGMAVGTPAYMAPEQASGGQVDARTDVYGLGCVLYEMLAGEPPFTGRTLQAVIAKQMMQPVPPLGHMRPGVPHWLDHTVGKALARVPADRFASAGEFAAALTAGTQSQGVHVPTRPRMDGRSPAWYAGIGIAATVIIALLVLSAHQLLGNRERSSGSSHSTASARGRPPAAPRGSIAVLPFINRSADPEQEYFSDGMTDELTSALGKIPGLRVAARSSSYTFKGKNADVREVGEQLQVATVLEGSVRRDGPRLRVAAQLVKATDGLSLWSETYERELKDVFQVQEDIARSIASALRLTLGAESEAHLIAGTPRSLEAHDLYLRGRFYFNKYTEPDLRRSLALYQQALARDSMYAPAWSGIADAWSNLADDYLPPREAYPKARAAAQRAIALDPALGEAHASLGLVLGAYDWDFAAAERESQRAMELNPNAATAYHYYGELLLGTPGRLDSALVVLRRAQSLDPLSAWTLEDVGWVFEIMGRYSEAIEQNRQALELDPHAWRALYFMARALLLAGRPDEALRTLGRAENPPALLRATTARALIALGRPDEARHVLRELEREAERRYVRPEAIAAVYVALGEHDAAFKWLEQAYLVRSADVTTLPVERHWAPIRSDPRFAALVRKARIP